MNQSANRLNRIARATGAKHYLEIGVSGGHTFRDVAVEFRTGVDPRFEFDIAPVINASTRLLTKTSDAFFAEEPVSSRYDLIYIDGLHKFEQVVRDLANALLHSDHRSVILLDDTIPTDVYSALPDQGAAIHYRSASGNSSRSWHGDVFKIVYYIHDFLPGLNYRTITDEGHGQTLVWRSARSDRPRFDNLETISRLTFFDLCETIEIMKPCTENEAVKLCFSQLRLPPAASVRF